MSNSSTGFTTTTTNPDHLFFASSAEQLCYVHCGFCDTVLAVSVPCSSLLKTVTVRCGHCSNLLSVNMRGLLLHTAAATSAASAANHHQLHLGPTPFFTSPHNLLEEIRNSTAPNLLMNHQAITNHEQLLPPPPTFADHLNINLKPPIVNRPPEKRQRVPSAYNRFIKDEIQRIKAGNPDISHREAFSAAAKNWAHFPHIHFGLMPDIHQPVKKANMRQQDGEDHVDVVMKDGFLATQANVGVAPY